jgi:hypothetical protein
MTRSWVIAAALLCLTARTAAAQYQNYYLAIPPVVAGTSELKAAPIPNLPFAPAPNVRLAGGSRIDPAFKLLGPWAPLWLGPDMVALAGTLKGQVTLMAWYGNHFNRSRAVADSQTVHGATILDMAASRDGKQLAIAAATADKLEIWTGDTHGDAPLSLAATIDGACDKAGLAWLGADKLAVGALFTPSAAAPPDQPPSMQGQGTPPAPPQPQRSLYIVQLGTKQPPLSLDLDCLKHIDPWTLTWSPDGHYGVALSGEQAEWTLIDRIKSTCAAVKQPGVAPVGFIQWGADSARFLFTATPQRLPDPSHLGVMEYRLDTRKARLLGSPATAASYVGGPRIAVLGSQRLNAATMAATPDKLYAAEIAWLDPAQAELNIVPTGLVSSGAQLLQGHLNYSAANGLLAANFQTSNRSGPFTVLLWLSAAVHNGGILGTGRMGRMVTSWSPDGAKLAILAGLPDHPTLAIVAAPR